MGPEPAGLCWGEALGAAQSSGQLAELAGSWAGLREPARESSSVHLSLAERAGPGLSPGLVGQGQRLWKALETGKCQRERRLLCALGGMHRAGRGPRTFVTTSLCPQPLPALAAQPRFALGSVWLWPSSILLQGSGPVPSHGQPCPASLLAQSPAEPGAGLSVQAHRCQGLCRSCQRLPSREAMGHRAPGLLWAPRHRGRSHPQCSCPGLGLHRGRGTMAGLAGHKGAMELHFW